MNKTKLLKLLKTFLPLGLGVFFVFYSFYGFSAEERKEVIQNITQIKPLWLIIALTGGILSHMSRAYRWKLLVEPMGYKLRFSTAFMAVMGGYLANLGIPRSGEVLRGATAATYDDIPFEKTFGTIIAERAVDVVIVLGLVSTAVLLHTGELLSFFENYGINPWISLSALIVLIFIGVGVLKFIKNSQWSIFLKIKKFASGILEGVKSIFNMEKPWIFILHTFFIWGMYVMMFYILKFAFPEMHSLPFSSMLAAFVVGSFSISVTNGGVGIYPIAIGVVLSLFGISKETGEAFGWVDWGLQTIISIVIGGASLILLPILNKPKEGRKQKSIPDPKP